MNLPIYTCLLFKSVVLTFDQLNLCLLCPLLYKALLEERDITIDGNHPCHQILPYKDNRNSPPLSEYIQNAASNHSFVLGDLAVIKPQFGKAHEYNSPLYPAPRSRSRRRLLRGIAPAEPV